MTIRTRLTIWFAAVFTGSLLVMGVGTFIEISEQLRHAQRQSPEEGAVEETAEMIFEAGLPAVLLGLLGGWWLLRRTLAPLAELTRAVEKIHDRNLSERLPRPGNGDELDRLTDVFNAMTARLNGSFQHIREFTLHASHELKTPLTILRGELELALQEPATAAQKERLASQIDEIERLAKIVDGLTLLTKADAGQITLKVEPVRLDNLVRESVLDTKILAQAQDIQVRLDPCDEVTVAGDRHRLRQLLLDLADNAVKYNQRHGQVDFSLQRDGTSAVLKISNTGPGLQPELLTRVFERFFRGDTAVEGCGLGLSIAQWIVLAHHGKIDFVSQPNSLTTVTVRLPSA
ncbi:MAG TPA: HAMP domain-containing sensor histidine kinase [Candidatus Acidoferrales bacterium]|nr:HAMP domain-containing sensor histidine kinase [Candidatus Acidoferrales bacterium]